jgi:hypothetical protein
MAELIRNPKDFWTGVLYLLFGAAALWLARDYGMGSAGRMGPGYFPNVLAALLMLFGVISVVRSFVVPGPPIGKIAIKAAVLIIGATLAFGFLLPRAGLIVALLALVLIAASASERFRFDWKALAGLVVLVAFCALVFVKALGVPMPLAGTWLAS